MIIPAKYIAILIITFLIFEFNELFVTIPFDELHLEYEHKSLEAVGIDKEAYIMYRRKSIWCYMICLIWRTFGCYMLLTSLNYVYEAMSLLSGQQVDIFLYRR